jgi:hypothetical protein
MQVSAQSNPIAKKMAAQAVETPFLLEHFRIAESVVLLS